MGGSTKQFIINNTSILYIALPDARIGLSGAALQSNVDIRYDNYVLVNENCPFPTQDPDGFPWFEQEQDTVVLERPALATFVPGD